MPSLKSYSVNRKLEIAKQNNCKTDCLSLLVNIPNSTTEAHQSGVLAGTKLSTCNVFVTFTLCLHRCAGVSK